MHGLNNMYVSVVVEQLWWASNPNGI